MKNHLFGVFATIVLLILGVASCGGGSEASDSEPDDLLSCIDEDGDGYGSGCTKGSDCDDSDPDKGLIELPGDGIDNDCDGSVDEDKLLDACAGLGGNCFSNPIGNPGVNGGKAFDTDEDPSDGVAVNDQGHLVLSSSEINTSYIWIANSSQGTIAKVDTRQQDEDGQYVEVARYATGAINCGTDDPENFAGCQTIGGFKVGTDPSRTTVNGLGNVIVGDRNEGRVTMIATDTEQCGDTNGDGLENNTSTGPGDILPWDTSDPENPVPVDDCIKWTTDLQAWAAEDEVGSGNVNHIRAMAAQDIEGLDGTLLNFVWVGDTEYRVDGSNRGAIWKLNASTGEVQFSTRIDDCRPYGFALDGNENLWVSCRQSGGMARLDTRKCLDETCRDVPTCHHAADEDVCNDQSGDLAGTPVADATKERIELTGSKMYGMTIDFKQRAWIASDNGRVFRYDTSLDPADRLASIDLGAATRGVTADLKGFIYVAQASGSSVWQLRGDDLTGSIDSTAGVEFVHRYENMVGETWGLATDLDGKVWAMGRYRNTADVITPTDTLGDALIESDGAQGLVGTYTYSDMTGSQLRFATNPDGFYQSIFEGCEAGATNWLQLVWDAETPADTQVVWFIRSASSKSELQNEGFMRIAEVPGSASPLDLAQAMSGAGITPGNFLEIQVQLKTANTDPSKIVTPIVKGYDASYSCGQILE